ncbi:VirB3 family type IV secretion system protein [Rubrivirga litoralis]|uniref:VirB3 family type IV secretion system protein n=1 Tax=Rubrivirga litoralis TaxID=3075598 RepID=A0ABU3BRK5_9BACT|nr:VirB3 family type IV secretion system protein [Rubrivirga sp. F394]MDT0631918.1 VirB3 family type IV secretion system protein [Rubrivirga sp. F394]
MSVRQRNGGGERSPAAGRLPERLVHQSLVRVPRYAGVDRSFLVLEVTLVVCLGYLMGLSWATAAVVVVVVGVVHPLMVRLSDADDLLPQLLARTLMQADAYGPLPPVSASPRRPSRSVPTA